MRAFAEFANITGATPSDVPIAPFHGAFLIEENLSQQLKGPAFCIQNLSLPFFRLL